MKKHRAVMHKEKYQSKVYKHYVKNAGRAKAEPFVNSSKCPKCKTQFADINHARAHFTRLCAKGWTKDKHCKACVAITQGCKSQRTSRTSHVHTCGWGKPQATSSVKKQLAPYVS
jgi:hypothetical protein